MGNYKKKLILFIMTVILISPILSPSIVGAITESTQSSETATTTESTTEQSASTASTEQTNASEDQETETSVEETIMETNYEERELSDEALEPTPHPVVQLEEEKRGNLLVQNENDQQITRLTKLILQTKQDEEEWQNSQEYDVEDNYNLSEAPYSFEYGADPFQRIIVEYSVEEYQDGRLIKRTKHMAHYMFEELETFEEVPSSEVSEEIGEDMPPLDSEKKIYKKSKSVFNSSISEESYSLRGTLNGIVPLAVPTPSIGDDYKRYGGWADGCDTRIENITKTTATIYGEYAYSVNGNRPIIVWSESDSYGYVSMPKGVMESINTKKEATSFYYSQSPKKMTWSVNLDKLKPGKTYYFWFYQLNQYNTAYSAVPGGYCDGQTSPGAPTNGPIRYSFTTKSAVPLVINKPVFLQNEAERPATPTSVRMKGQSYRGDIWQENNQGKIQITSVGNPNILAKEITNLGHTTVTGTTNDHKYNDYNITGLKAGTRYQGQVVIKNLSGDWVNSGWTSEFFYTPNIANTPAEPTKNIPTTANDATAAISATYAVGNVAAHPSTVEVQYYDPTIRDWTTINTGTTPATTTPEIKRGSNEVSFTVSKLKAKTNNSVRYRVKNDSGVWSNYAPVDFKTNGRALSKVEKPKFENLTPTSARMKDGNYVGDVRWDATVNGNLFINCNALSDPVVKNLPVSYQNTFSGKYFSRDIEDLTPGTRYVAEVRLRDAQDTVVTSGTTDGGWTELITPNRVKKPTVTSVGRPPTPTTGEASVKAEYEVGADPRHPSSQGVTDGISGKGVKVEIKEGNGSFISITEDSSSSPSTIRIKPNSLNINSGHATPNVTFDLIGLKSKTTYTIQVSVKNDSGVWSPVDDSNRQNFTTLGAVLSVSTPTFDLDSGNATSINQNQGSYQGDATAPDTVGKVYLRSNDNANPASPVISNLQTLSSGNKYAGATLTNLLPGTKYSSRVEIRDYQPTPAYVSSLWGSFVTPNELVTNPIVTKTTPTTAANARVAIEGTYKAGNANATAAHPNKLNVKISTDGINYESLPDADSNTTGPKLSSNDVFDQTNKKINIGIVNLLEGTRYYVKYSVENERKKNNGDPFPSNEIQVDFETLTRPNGFYINEVPEPFNFGTVELSENNMTHPLQNVSGGGNYFSVDFENINMNSQWTLSAKLSKIQVEGEQQTLTGSKIVMDKELKKTSDGGSTWDTPDSSKFDPGLGIQENSISLPADGETSVPLFKATDIPYGIGHFENRIAKDSVRLFVPRNTGERGKTYSGSITWTMDNLA